MRFAAIIALLTITVLVMACGKSEPPPAPEQIFEPECYTASDCASGPCMQATCDSGYCGQTVIYECCGNFECEDWNAGEDKCNCPEDCPSQGCEGNAEFTLPNGAQIYSDYFTNECVGKTCGIKYDPAKIDPNQEYHEIEVEGVMFGVTIGYIQPFEINHGEIEIEFQSKDFGECTVDPPVSIHEIRILDNTVILGRKRSVGWHFKNLRQTESIKIPISYSMAVPEEQKIVMIEFDYEVQKKRWDYTDTGMQICIDPVYDAVVRSKGNLILQNTIAFIDPNYDRMKVDFSKE